MAKIKFTDLETIEVTTNKKVLKKIPVVAQKLALSLGIELSDVLLLIGLNNGNYTKDQTKLASEYGLLQKDHEKELFLIKNKSISKEQIEKINSQKIDILDKLKNVPSNLAKILILNENESMYDELIDLLTLATDKSKDDLEETDIYILIEVFVKLFIKPNKDLERALFLNQVAQFLKSLIQSFNFLKEGKNFIQNIKQI